MATGVKPRDEETQFTRADLEAIQDAMKNKKFRDLLSEYCEEVRDPANQALYQKEMTQLEKERGYDVTFINPKGGYVIKTSVAGDRKAFINICSSDNVGKPSYTVQEINGQKGMNWQIPYSLIPPREDFDHKKQRCVIYDVVFHPDTLRMSEVNKPFRDIVNKTALDGLRKTYDIHLDNNNFRFPKSYYKGMATPAVIRKEDPNYKPAEEDTENLPSEVLEKLYPQHNYPQKVPDPPAEAIKTLQQKRKMKTAKPEFSHVSENGYTVPKYVIKQQKSVDLQEFTYHKESKQYSAIPSHIIVEIYLPLLSSTKDCNLDVREKILCLVSEKPAKYRLNITLPYSVNDDCGNAKFDKSKHMLIVTLPVIQKNFNNMSMNSLKIDSGLESEENSGSQSDEDNSKDKLVEELSSKPAESPLVKASELSNANEDTFFDSSLGYILPHYTHNVLDDVIAFTFHVKNTEPESLKVKNDANRVYIKFTTIGTGFVPIHYAATIIFEKHVSFESVTGEAWDNNVILQLEFNGDAPQKFDIGLSENSMTSECLEIPQVKKPVNEISPQEVDPLPVVEVTNLGNETNIVVSSNYSEYDDENDIESSTLEESEIVWTDLGSCDNGAKSILRKPISTMRTFSESSVGDVASSMDYISSDCIPEESSLKKTVRFNDVIARQFYRYNSSIEGQKKKNQRKKSKKRSLERRKSESEAEDEFLSLTKESKSRLKSVLKQRRDSGLADTSDAEADCKIESVNYKPSSTAGNIHLKEADEKKDVITSNEKHKSVLNIVDKNNVNDKPEPIIWQSISSENLESNSNKHQDKTKKYQTFTSANIKHNTDLYNPDNLNKGQYLEVSFKNDLIFDLDM